MRKAMTGVKKPAVLMVALANMVLIWLATPSMSVLANGTWHG